jgi:hypothetical protein
MINSLLTTTNSSKKSPQLRKTPTNELSAETRTGSTTCQQNMLPRKTKIAATPILVDALG